MVQRASSGAVEYIRKFNAYRIIEHLVIIALFFILAVTGLSQKFYDLRISQLLIGSLGGIDSTRLVHHVAGALFTLLAAQHVAVNFAGVIFFQWEPSMLITFKDVQDALQNVRYYLGLDEREAICGRYGYKEKFIYWLILLGGIQQIVSGFILWFPVAMTTYLPGQIVPAAKAVHTNEAMMIFTLMAIWHIYDSMFSPDIFPLNKSIFTGYVEKKKGSRMEHPGKERG